MNIEKEISQYKKSNLAALAGCIFLGLSAYRAKQGIDRESEDNQSSKPHIIKKIEATKNFLKDPPTDVSIPGVLALMTFSHSRLRRKIENLESTK